jgi:hypothetical protein
LSSLRRWTAARPAELNAATVTAEFPSPGAVDDAGAAEYTDEPQSNHDDNSSSAASYYYETADVSSLEQREPERKSNRDWECDD